MAKQVYPSETTPRFMYDREFEDEAALLLVEYGNKNGQVTAPPVPIDEIVAYLKIATEFGDLRAKYPEGDVLGEIWFSRKLITIDERLVPEDFPAMLARYRFTLAHELAHWRLHRYLYLRRGGRGQPPRSSGPRPDHVLRSRQTDPKEVQANRFAACLQMPREMVKRVWHEWRGGMDPIRLGELRDQTGTAAADEQVLEEACRPLADKFEVSAQAMRIRLEGMGLLVRE
jgi:hypothetical protein